MTGMLELPLHDLDAGAFRARVEAALAGFPSVRHHEVYASFSAGTSVLIEKDSMKDAILSKDAGFGIRVGSASGQVGFTFASRFDRSSVENIIRKAVSLMNAATPDPDFHGFAERVPLRPLDPADLFDCAVASLDPERAIALASETASDARAVGDPRVYSINVMFSASATRAFIFNSEGVEAREDGTVAGLSCEVTVKDGPEMSSGSESKTGRMLARIAPSIGSAAARQALSTLGGVAIPSRACPVVLSEKATATVVCATVAQSASAEQVQQGASFLQGRAGTDLAPAWLSLVDDGRDLAHSRAGTSSFDAEGTPTTRTALIDKGTFTGCLHNSYTARKEGLPSTGNAMRGGYATPPMIAPSNLILEASPGATAGSREELLEGISWGIYFDQTHDSVNMTTGDYSGMMSDAWIIEHGEITRRVKQAAFGTTMLDLLGSMELAGRELNDRGSITCPAIRVRSMHVSGAT